MAQANDSAEIVVPELVYFTQNVHHDTYDKILPSRPELSAKGKNVLVTGGGSGIGKAIATAFAQAGADSVSILGRREDRLRAVAKELENAITHSATKFFYEVADLEDATGVVEAFESIAAKLGSSKLDILVSNAGTLQELGPIVGYDGKEFMRGFNINVLTAFNAVQAFLPLASQRPTIINVSSCAAHFANPMPMISGYTVSKAANLKMMDCVAKENPGVHVVNLQPGTVATEMAEKAGVPGKDTAELPGHFSVWLASPEAEFLKGKFVWANWDVDELRTKAEEIRSSRLFTWGLEGVPM